MQRYSRSQKKVISEYNSDKLLPEFIRQIILRRPLHIPLKIQLQGTSVDTKDIAKSFEQSCYDLMSNDHNRTNSYAKWILDVCENFDKGNTENKYWFEIGPGSNVTLGLILLSKFPNANYNCVEINELAYRKCKKILQNYPNAYVSKNFVDNKFYKSPEKIDYIFHEIFGVIASSEGVVLAINSLKQRYPLALSIPSYAATYIAPLDIKVDDIIRDQTLIINRKLFKCKIPFNKTQITDCHAILEKLNFDDIIQNQTNKTKCKISRDGKISALGIYIEIGMNDLYTSSNCDKENASCNWTNVGLVLPKVIDVKRNQFITIICKTFYNTSKPNYCISLEICKENIVWSISYDDLYGLYKDLHTIK